MAVTNQYAPEYSQQNRQQLVGGYADLLDPYYQKSKRSLASILAGTPGMWGSPRLSGTGEIESARIGQIGQYAQGLSQQALDAQRQERLTAEGRAYEDPYRQAGLTGMFGGQQTMAGQQNQSALASAAQQREYVPKTFAEQQRQFDTGQGNWGQQFGEQQRQFDTGQGNWGQQFGEQQRQFDTGQGNWGQQFGEQQRQFDTGQGNWGQQFGEQQRQFDTGQGNWGQQFGEQQRQFDTGQGNWGQQFGLQQQQMQDALKTSELNRQWYPSQFTGTGPDGQSTMARDQMIASLTGQYGESPTAQYQAQMMPYITQGYVSPQTSGFGGMGIQTEQQLQRQTPEWQQAQQLGFSNPYQMALYAQLDPEGMKKMFQNSQARTDQQSYWGLPQRSVQAF